MVNFMKCFCLLIMVGLRGICFVRIYVPKAMLKLDGALSC